MILRNMKNSKPKLVGRSIVYWLTVVALMLAACTPITAPPPAVPAETTDPLDGTTWVLTALDTEPPVAFDAAAVEVTLGFAEGSVNGRSGCNQYGGPYEIDGDQLSVGDLFSTMMMCPDEAMAVETAFIAGLAAAERFEHSGDELVIVHPRGRLIFARADNTGAEVDEAAAPLPGVLTGVVIYRQRIALPAGAVVNVQLQDVSRADAAATVIAEQTITTTGEQVPIPFELTYDPAEIDERFTYAIGVRITIEGQLAWINTSQHGVLTRGAPVTDVEVIVEPV